MQKDEEIFEIVVNINQGLEPLTFTIIVYDDIARPEHEMNFKVTRDTETIGILRPDAEHCWHLLDGNMEQEQVDAIGAAIDGHYAAIRKLIKR